MLLLSVGYVCRTAEEEKKLKGITKVELCFIDAREMGECY